jgi:haloalkane dehalogenase/tRNA(adenine34) deaminase
VAPDFFGFGQSDKPTEWDTYTFDFHRRTVLELVDALDLDRITLVCQDWGGLIGLTLPLDLGRRISRLIVMNTTLAVGESPGKGFESWKAYVASRPDFDVSGLMARSVPGITPGELSAYDAPFPDATYKIGVRTFPQIVPVRPDMPGAEISHAAAQWWSTEWDGPTFMAVGLQDPVLGGPVMQRLQQVIRGCPPPLELPDAGHFAQEAGDVVAEAALAAFGG